MHKSTKLMALLAVVVLAAAACTSSGGSASVDPTLLGKIVAAGKIRISTDPNYKPFSFLNITTNEYEGFDTSTAEETVKRLSDKLGKDIKLEWETPGWDTITAGSWGGRWDISIGSMSVTVGRAKVVDFIEPYYFDSGAVAVPKDSTVQSLAELNDGKTFCVGAVDDLRAVAEGHPRDRRPEHRARADDAQTSPPCRPTTSASRPSTPAASSTRSSPMATAWPTRSAEGAPIRVLSRPADLHRLRRVRPRQERTRRRDRLKALLDQIVAEMHADGTLKGFSEKWFEGKDVTTKPT